MSRLIELEDTLGEASGFMHAIFLAAAGLGDSQNTNAIQMVAMELSERLEKARCIIDDLRSAPLVGGQIGREGTGQVTDADIAGRTYRESEEAAEISTAALRATNAKMQAAAS